MFEGLSMELKNPPPLSLGTLRVIPLGGLGEVGRNCTVLEMIDPIPQGYSRLMLLDCGVLFPGDDEPGVDLLLPDFTYLHDKLDRIEAIYITHGHEDHIGAIPFLLKLRPDIPLVGSRFSLALIKKKLEQHRITPVTFEVNPGDELRFGPFLLNFLPVNHSIPDALAVFVRTSAGNVLDTGDFKMDQTPLDGKLTDLKRFTDASRVGVDLFMVDSTNAMNPGFVPSEAVVEAELNKIFAGITTGIVFATTFASHIHRVAELCHAAMKNNRKIALLGRSMLNNVAIAQELKMLDVPEGAFVDLKDVPSLPPERVCIICTGSQGESMAALSRMARREHPTVNINPEDTVVMASSTIPGNEKVITAMLNNIEEIGAKVFDARRFKVHCSGHANEGELMYIYNVVEPRNVLPIHGEVRHLKANARIANRSGVNENNIPVVQSGGVIDLANGHAKVVGRIENGYLFVDGREVGSVTQRDLEQRLILSQEGFVAVSTGVDVKNRKVVSYPKVIARAIAEDDSVFGPLAHKVHKALTTAMNDEGMTNTDALAKVVKRVAAGFISRELHRRPMILPIVHKK
ncbi:MAG: ribonuclease J [Candidatus Ancillula sp.]|jgi:ribonuclease J|nr:ribonuclease J [Candidatus Ancillula sp.]